MAWSSEKFGDLGAGEDKGPLRMLRRVWVCAYASACVRMCDRDGRWWVSVFVVVQSWWRRCVCANGSQHPKYIAKTFIIIKTLLILLYEREWHETEYLQNTMCNLVRVSNQKSREKMECRYEWRLCVWLNWQLWIAENEMNVAVSCWLSVCHVLYGNVKTNDTHTHTHICVRVTVSVHGWRA